MADKKKFIELVAEMRKTQKRWFDYHREVDLIKSKQLEKQVDHAIAIWRGAPRQKQMFQGD